MNGPYHFGLGAGWLPARADEIAKRHGAVLVNTQQPNRDKRHYFAAPNKGGPHNKRVSEAVMADLRAAGILADE